MKIDEPLKIAFTWYETKYHLPIPYVRVLGVFEVKEGYSFQLCTLREVKLDGHTDYDYVWSGHGHKEPLLWCYCSGFDAENTFIHFNVCHIELGEDLCDVMNGGLYENDISDCDYKL